MGKVRLKVLVMDDEEMIRDLSSEMLEMLGHTAESVYGGEEAVQRYADAKANGGPFDLSHHGPDHPERDGRQGDDRPDC